MKLARLRKVAATLAGLALAVLLATTVSDHVAGEKGLTALTPSPDLIRRGAYLARLGDCAACHSVPGQPPFTGGLAMSIPVGTIYTTNITFDKKEGIGDFSLSDFDRALRFGVSHGHTLYPAMPYPSYSILKPSDVQALYAYFKYGVAASATPNVPDKIIFPLSMRFPLTMWRWTFAPKPSPFAPTQGMDAGVADGEYFVEGLGHCGECHTPRGLGMQVKAQSAQDGNAFLSGARVDNWYAPSLRGGTAPGELGDWSADELAEFIRSGVNHNSIAFGSMSDVIEHSTQYMTERDAEDAAKFLKSLDRTSTSDPFRYNDTITQALRNGDAHQRGAMLYLDNCAACHRPDGQGYDEVFPRLAGNPSVESPDPTSVISIVLAGSKTVRTERTPAQFQMPSFAWRLSDDDIADVVTFVRASWGNRASGTHAFTVGSLRKQIVASDGVNAPTTDREISPDFLPVIKPAGDSL